MSAPSFADAWRRKCGQLRCPGCGAWTFASQWGQVYCPPCDARRRALRGGLAQTSIGPGMVPGPALTDGTADGDEDMTTDKGLTGGTRLGTAPDRPGDAVDLESTRVRDMREIAREARRREELAVYRHDLHSANLYADVARRAEELVARESDLRFAAQLRGVHAPVLKPGRRMRQLGIILLAGAVVVAAGVLLFGCSAVPLPPKGNSVEVLGGLQRVTSAGHNSLEDFGQVPTAELSWAQATGDWGVQPEAFLQGGRIDARDVDAGDLGLFDAEGYLVRAGAGLRGPVGRVGGLVDVTWSAGACVTIVSGTASAGPDLSRDVSKSGAGLYLGGDCGRGPFFVRVRYVLGPEVEDDGVRVKLGGVEVMGGLRWDL